MSDKIDLSLREDKELLWNGYKKLHSTLRVPHCTQEYYDEINALFRGCEKLVFMQVIKRMVAEHRSYAMPTRGDFSNYLVAVNRDNSFSRARKAIGHRSPANKVSEEDIAKMEDMFEEWAKSFDG